MGINGDYGETPSIAGLVIVDSSANGAVEEPDDRDWFAVSLEAGKSYQIDLVGITPSAGALSDTFIEGVFDSSGIHIADIIGDDGGISVNSVLELTATSEGNHYTSASAFSIGTGTYLVIVPLLLISFLKDREEHAAIEAIANHEKPV